MSRVFTGTERSLEQTRWWQRFKDALQFADVPIPPVQVAFGTTIVVVIAVFFFGLYLGLVDYLLAMGLDRVIRYFSGTGGA